MVEIIINARFLTQPVTGVQRYGYELVRALDLLFSEGKIDPDKYSIRLAVPPGEANRMDLKYIKTVKIGWLKGNLWEQISLPIFTRNKILFNPCNTGPIFAGRRQAATFHDASVFAFSQAYTLFFRLKYQMILTILGRVSQVLFTDSDFSKKELVQYCGIKPEKLMVVPLGHEHILAKPAETQILTQNGLKKKGYLLAVSSYSPHKNFPGFIQAVQLMKSSEMDIVIIGGTYHKVFKSIHNLPDLKVIKLGYVNDRELRALYENAACFIYPTFYEGFGLPPLEAMACGCPVIASDKASLPEVCGNGVIYCDPNNPQDIADKIQMVLMNLALQQELIDKGKIQASRFQWRKTAEQIWHSLAQTFS